MVRTCNDAMSTRFWISLAAALGGMLASFAAAMPSLGQDAGKAPFRNAPSHEDLAAAYERSKGEDPIRGLGQDPEILAQAKEYSQASLLDRSDALAHSGLATLLPKGAVLFVPEAMAGRASLAEGTVLVDWREFYRSNSHWLLPWNVRLAQAIGEEPLDLGQLERLKRMGKVVVATCFDQPISLHEGALVREEVKEEQL